MLNQLQNSDTVFPPRSRYTFKLLAADIFTYALENIGLLWVWDPPEEVKSITKHVFEPVLGDAVTLFLDRHKKKPGVFNWDHEVSIKTLEDMREYINVELQEILRDDCFLMDVIRILAFFVDLITRFYIDDNFHLIEPALNCLDETYIRHLRRPLFIVGGYHALFLFSKQYVDYNSTLIESPADITAAVGNSLMDVDKDYKMAMDVDKDYKMAMDVDKDYKMAMDVDTKEFDLKETKTLSACGSAKPSTPFKFNSKIKEREIFTRTMLNEFSSPHSDPCSSGFSRTPDLNKSETKTNIDRGSAKPFTHIKFNCEMKEILNRALKNEFSTPHSDHCPSEFSKIDYLDESETKPNIKTDILRRKLSFSD